MLGKVRPREARLDQVRWG